MRQKSFRKSPVGSRQKMIIRSPRWAGWAGVWLSLTLASAYFVAPARNARLLRCPPGKADARTRSALQETLTMRWQSISTRLEVPASASEAFSLYKELDRHPEWSLW